MTDAPPSAVVKNAAPDAMTPTEQPLAGKLRGHAAMIRSGAFTAGQDEDWFAASLERLADTADADLSAQEALMAEMIEGLRTLILPGPLPTAGAKALHACIEGRRKFAFDLLAKIEGRAG